MFVGSIIRCPGSNSRGTQLDFCNDAGEWPPYIYFRRNDGEKTNEPVGYDIDILDEILSRHGISFKMELIAWTRCLHEIETGDKYKLVSSSAHSEERASKYLMTDAYYIINPHYFYPVANFPDGLKITSPVEFSNYKVCGIRGYSYDKFGIPLESIDTGTRILSQLIEKTERGRCDIFLGRYEIFAGFAQTTTDYIKKHHLDTAPMPGVSGEKFYMMISRNYEHGEELRKLINDGIAELHDSGEGQKLLAHYLE